MSKYNNFLILTNNTKNIKQYDASKTIPKEKLEKIFKASNNAPTSFNLENWRVLNFRRGFLSQENIEKFFDIGNIKKINDASDLSVFIYKNSNFFDKNNKSFTDKIENNYKALFDIEDEKIVKEKIVNTINYFASMDKNILNPWSRQQAFIGITYMTFAASSLNISSSIIGGFKPSFSKWLLDNKYISKDEDIATMCLLGYADNQKAYIKNKKIRTDYKEKFTILN